MKQLTFYLSRLMQQTGQGDSSTLWHLTVELFAKCSTEQVRETFVPFDNLQLSCLLREVPNRSGGLFYLLTFLRFNSKRSTKQVRKDYSIFQHFYGLACYTKHQKVQKRFFYHLTLLRFSFLLCKIPNRLRRTLLPFDTFMVRLFIFNSELDGNHKDGLITLVAVIRVCFACLVVWSANFIAELF